MEVKEDTFLSEILKNPQLLKVLEKYNLPCLSCPFAKMEIDALKLEIFAKCMGSMLKNYSEN